MLHLKRPEFPLRLGLQEYLDGIISFDSNGGCSSGLPSKLVARERFSRASTSWRVCARGVARSAQSLMGVKDVVRGGGETGLLDALCTELV
jgi:hypothetical protein